MSAISRLMIQICESLAIGTTPTPPLVTCVMHLYANPVSWTRDTPQAAITECTFDGYAPKTLNSAFVGPQLNLGGDTVVTPTVPQFGCSGTVTVNQVYGSYITGPGTTGASWLVGGSLPPFTPSPGVSFAVTPQVVLSGSVDTCAC